MSDAHHFGEDFPEQRHATLDMTVSGSICGEAVDSVNEAGRKSFAHLFRVAESDHAPDGAGILGAHGRQINAATPEVGIRFGFGQLVGWRDAMRCPAR